jgi:hypothetical protein
MLTQSSLREMIKQALQAHDPEEYNRLQADGSLDFVAEMRAEAAMETRDYLMSQAIDEALTSTCDPMERIRRHMMKNRQANEIAIAQATEFEPNDVDSSNESW